MELLRQQEAISVIESADDLVTRQLLWNAHFALIRRYLAQTEDLPDVDACFLMEVMRDMFSEKHIIRRILDGEDLRWWPPTEADSGGNG